MAVNVEYNTGAMMSYFLSAHMPWEGYVISFNGTKGRLEHIAHESTYISGDGSVPGRVKESDVSTKIIRNFSPAEEIKVRTGEGGHGGGDDPLLASVFESDPPADPLGRAAGAPDGAYSILSGVAAYHSIDRGDVVSIDELLGEWANKL
jgi:hypothetical protein